MPWVPAIRPLCSGQRKRAAGFPTALFGETLLVVVVDLMAVYSGTPNVILIDVKAAVYSGRTR
ncbi:MAG: hypothetical protein VCE75_22525 [Alphaproteobacteria bacterium]